MTRPSLFCHELPDGRLHLQEGPIDLVIEAFGAAEEVQRAYAAATQCFEEVLPGLVAELPELRRPAGPTPFAFQGPVARRMALACRPHHAARVTPMAAVAGAVADHVLAAMTAAAGLARAYVNDGGDIALHLAPGERLACGLVAELHHPRLDGRAVIAAETPIRGIATSGRATLGEGGRSFSLGIADAVTVFARSAAEADVAATLVANAVDLPGHAAIRRRPACEIDPDSDLGRREVTVAVGALSAEEIAAALARGLAEARSLRAAGLLEAAVLFLRGEAEVVGGEGLLPRVATQRGSPSPHPRLSSRGQTLLDSHISLVHSGCHPGQASASECEPGTMAEAGRQAQPWALGSSPRVTAEGWRRWRDHGGRRVNSGNSPRQGENT
jgi:hypothetical protein